MARLEWLLLAGLLAVACRPGAPLAAGLPAPESSAPGGRAGAQTLADREQVTVERLAQLTLDHSKLAPYFHERERKERSPLIVVRTAQLGPTVHLTKFGRPVVMKDRTALARGEPFFEFTSVEAGQTTGRVQFRYPPEGLRGTALFRRDDTGAWSAVSIELSEQ
jgi:hypothetical protein